MNCNSSRSGTNVSCLRSKRRKILLSFSTTPRAASGSNRIKDETVFRVLNKKCGLIWLDSASMRAFSSNCWCRSRFISTRVLFQIFSGAATDITVAKTHSSSHQFQYGSMANSHFGFVAMASATRPNSRPTHASSGSNSQDICAWRTRRTTSRGIFKNVNGPKFHKSSLLGMAWRIKPPSKPAVDAAGMASHSCPINAGTVMIAPPIGPTTRPPSKPIKNAPSSDRSPNRYGNPTNRNETPRIKGGVMNNISFSFWSGSRSSVNSTRRKVFQRASSAAIDDATPTFSSSANSRSLTEVSVSIANANSGSSLTLANPCCDVKGSGNFTSPAPRGGAKAPLRRAGGLQSFALQGRPGVIASEVLPHAAQPPGHVHLSVRKVFQKAVGHQPHHVLPVVVALVRNFYLQYRADGNHRRKRVSKQQKLQKESPAQHSQHRRENDGCESTDFNDRCGQLKQPQIWQRKPADAPVAWPEQHVAARPQHVPQSFLPARALPSQRFQIRRDFRPAHRVGNKMDLILGVFQPQMPVHARDQIKILADAVDAIASDRADQVRPKQSEGPGNDHQHVSLPPRFPADQERAKVLDHLDHLDSLARQPHSSQLPLRNLRTVQHANDSTHGHHVLGISENREHDAQQRVALQHRIGVHHADVRRSCHIQPGIHRIRFAASRLFIDHQQPGIGVAPIKRSNRGALHIRDVHRAHRPQLKLFAHFLEGAVLGTVIDHNDFEFRIIELQQIAHRDANGTFFVVCRRDEIG